MDCRREAADSPGGMARELQPGVSGSARAARPGPARWRLLRARSACLPRARPSTGTGPGGFIARFSPVRSTTNGSGLPAPWVGAETAQEWALWPALLYPAATSVRAGRSTHPGQPRGTPVPSSLAARRDPGDVGVRRQAGLECRMRSGYPQPGGRFEATAGAWVPISSHGWPRRTSGGATPPPEPRAVHGRTRPVRHVPPPAWVHPGPAMSATPTASRPPPAGPSAPACAIPGAFLPTPSIPPHHGSYLGRAPTAQSPERQRHGRSREVSAGQRGGWQQREHGRTRLAAVAATGHLPLQRHPSNSLGPSLLPLHHSMPVYPHLSPLVGRLAALRTYARTGLLDGGRRHSALPFHAQYSPSFCLLLHVRLVAQPRGPLSTAGLALLVAMLLRPPLAPALPLLPGVDTDRQGRTGTDNPGVLLPHHAC
jgi:hypothetical protein